MVPDFAKHLRIGSGIGSGRGSGSGSGSGSSLKSGFMEVAMNDFFFQVSNLVVACARYSYAIVRGDAAFLHEWGGVVVIVTAHDHDHDHDHGNHPRVGCATSTTRNTHPSALLNGMLAERRPGRPRYGHHAKCEGEDQRAGEGDSGVLQLDAGGCSSYQSVLVGRQMRRRYK